MKSTLAIAGAGLSGAVLARELAEHAGRRVVVFDERPHLGGNCFTERDAATGVMVHVYGPHIFNTDRQDVWDYVNRFGEMVPYINRVKAITGERVYPLPINLHTINLFFGKTLAPAEARAFLAGRSDASIGEPQNFEEQALKFVGPELYRAFFYGYTKKQWGCEPRDLPASILARLPVRFDYNDNYYSTRLQGIPREGYTALIGRILYHPLIELRLGERIGRAARTEFDHLFFTGPIDGYFGHALGRLRYRTVTFERFEGEGDLQGNAVINYPEEAAPYTRVHEHRHFAPWETHERSVGFREFSRATGEKDTPYYPVRREDDKTLFAAYRQLAQAETGVSFLGRLATYRYLNMDRVIAEALDFSRELLKSWTEKKPAPVFPAASLD
jgi:UDP-galactopyranose mutase